VHNIRLVVSGFGVWVACFAAPPKPQNHRRQPVFVRQNGIMKDIILIIGVFLFFSCSNHEEKEKTLTVFDVVKSNDIDSLNNYLSKNKIKLDTTDYVGFSLLGYAIKNQNVEMVELLIEKGATMIILPNI